MGLRCLIGHDYGEAQTSRDVTERGNEVVVTVREYRECTRCGHTRVLSENKEVKAGGATEEPEPERDADAGAAWRADDGTDEGQSTVGAFAHREGERELSAEEDDGIILDDDEPAAPERAHGQWPESEVGGDEPEDPKEPEPWPDEESPSDPGTPDRPGEPGGDHLHVGPEPTAEPVEDETEILTDEGDEVEDRGSEQPSAGSEGQPRPDNRDREFVCPDCGGTWPTRNASLRPGDICPDCKRGYLQEQVVQ